MPSIRLTIMVATAACVVLASACRNRDPGDPPGTAKQAASRAPTASSPQLAGRPSASGQPRILHESSSSVSTRLCPLYIVGGDPEVTVDHDVLGFIDLQLSVVEKAGWLEAGGYRVEDADPCLAKLGFRGGDVLRSIDGRTLSDRWDAVAALRSVRGKERFSMGITRDGKRETLKYRIVPGHHLRARAGASQRTSPGEMTLDANQVAALEAKLVAQIGKTDDAHYKIPRSVLSQFSATEALRRHLRFVPERRGNETIGIRLSGVRAGGVLAALGLKEGDRVEKVGDRSLGHVEGALDAYDEVMRVQHTTVRIVRRGKPLVLHYEITD